MLFRLIAVTIMRTVFNMKGSDAASFMQLFNINTVAFLVSLHEFFTSTARIALLHSCIIPLVVCPSGETNYSPKLHLY